MKSIVSKFYPNSEVGAWLIIWPIFLGFQLVFSIFLTIFWIHFGLPQPSIASVPQCICTHPIDPMDIHLLRCVCDNKHIETHDVICDTLLPLCMMLASRWVENNYMHFPSNMFNSFRQQVDIVFTKDDICTLVDIIIVDPTWMDLLP